MVYQQIICGYYAGIKTFFFPSLVLMDVSLHDQFDCHFLRLRESLFWTLVMLVMGPERGTKSHTTPISYVKYRAAILYELLEQGSYR